MSENSAPATKHVWKFFRSGGLNQVSLETAEDLLALFELDQKLWVALSCPVKGLELDEQTLALIDADGDGHIHVREIIGAVNWAATHLKQPADLLRPGAVLPLSAINDLTPEGKILLSSARHILSSLGKRDAEAIAVEDTADTAKILAAKAPNGDGVITLRATMDPETQALIKDIIATVGGVRDPAGGEGVNEAKAQAFFAEVESYLKWVDATAARNVSELGDATGAACAALRTVRPKVDDYFARCRLAAFDGRATAALNRQESDYLGFAARDLAITSSEVAGFPLARVDPAGELPLLTGVNPAWRDALSAIHRLVIAPLFGAAKTTLTYDDWTALTVKFAPYESWVGSGGTSPIEKIGSARARSALKSAARRALNDLLAQDKALAEQYNAMSSVARLARYYRDLRTLLHNFINFADFYSHDGYAVFQSGILYLDSRSCELCIRVQDVNAHAGMAATSKAYIAYLDCRRKGGETMKVAACFTQGDSDYLFVGRNGLFYDRKNNDWDATITKIIDNPISIRQAFWSPYKKFLRMIEAQVAKRAAAADTAATAKLQTTATAAVTADPKAPAAAPPTPPPAAPKKFDVGTVAALGVALGALSTAFGLVFAKVVELPGWQLPLVVIGVILAISLPSMVIAWLKLRQRTVGPLLEANGWAINGRVKVNIPFGTALTECALLPSNSKRTLTDPYEDKGPARRRRLFLLLLLLAIAALLIRRDHNRRGHYFWQQPETGFSGTTAPAPVPSPPPVTKE
ncbi:MAG: hypothetical protein ACREH8_14830 [Opitutaceae bacterium]